MKKTLKRTESLSSAILMISWLIVSIGFFAVSTISIAISASKTGYTDGLAMVTSTIGLRSIAWIACVLMVVVMFRRQKDTFAGIVFGVWAAYCLFNFVSIILRGGFAFDHLATAALMGLFAADCFLKGNLAKYGWAFIALSLAVTALNPGGEIKAAMLTAQQFSEIGGFDSMTIFSSAWLPNMMNIAIELILSVAYICAAMSFVQEKTVQVVYADGTVRQIPVSETRDEGFFGMVAHVFLILFAGTIWTVIWSYRTTKYLNKAPDEAYSNPVVQTVLFLIVPFYSIYWFYQQGRRMDKLAHSCGINTSDAMACLLLGIFLPLGAMLLIQSRINNVSKACGTSEPQVFAQV